MERGPTGQDGLQLTRDPLTTTALGTLRGLELALYQPPLQEGLANRVCDLLLHDASLTRGEELLGLTDPGDVAERRDCFDGQFLLLPLALLRRPAALEGLANFLTLERHGFYLFPVLREVEKLGTRQFLAHGKAWARNWRRTFSEESASGDDAECRRTGD